MTATEAPLAPRQDILRAGARRRVRALAPGSAEAWLLGAVILAALVIRLLTIDNQSLWADEALTAYEASLPFGAMLHTVVHVETTPPLYFVLIWGWAKVFGTGAIALRSVSLIAGVAIVPLTALIAKRLFSPAAGVLAGALAAVNPFLVWYSQEARSYMLLAALTAGAFLAFLYAIEQPARRALLGWAVLSSLALATHFFAGFMVAPMALVLLWRHRTRAVGAAVAIVAVVQLAMFPFAVVDTGHGVGWIAKIGLKHQVGRVPLEWGVSALERRTIIPVGYAAGAVLLVVVIALLWFGGARATRRSARLAGSIIAFSLLAPLALALVGENYLLSRNVIGTLVPVLAVIAAACTGPRLRPAGAALAVVLLAGFATATYAVQTNSRLERPAWSKVAQALGPARVTRAVLVAGGTTGQPLKIYLPGVNWVLNPNHRVLIDEVAVVGDRGQMTLVRPGTAPDGPTPKKRLRGGPLPVIHAPIGTQRLGRVRVDNWVIAEFALDHPQRFTARELIHRAHRYFRFVPQQLLVFVQKPTG